MTFKVGQVFDTKSGNEITITKVTATKLHYTLCVAGLTNWKETHSINVATYNVNNKIWNLRS